MMDMRCFFYVMCLVDDVNIALIVRGFYLCLRPRIARASQVQRRERHPILFSFCGSPVRRLTTPDHCLLYWSGIDHARFI